MSVSRCEHRLDLAPLPRVPIAHGDSTMVKAAAHNALGHVTPEEFDQLSTNAACGKQQAELEGGSCLMPPLSSVSRGGLGIS